MISFVIYSFHCFHFKTKIIFQNSSPLSLFNFTYWKAKGFDAKSILTPLSTVASRIRKSSKSNEENDANEESLLHCHSSERCDLPLFLEAATGVVDGCDYSPILDTLENFGPRTMIASQLTLGVDLQLSRKQGIFLFCFFILFS